MLKYIILLYIFVLPLFSKPLNYAIFNKHASVLPKGKLQFKVAYLMVNDTIDILNIKADELGSRANSYDSIGNMEGMDIEVRYGISKRDSIFVKYQQWNINYGNSVLENKQLDIFNRFNLFSNDYAFFNDLSIDIGYQSNEANPIDIKDDSTINRTIKKIKPNSDITFNDGSIIRGGTIYTFYDSNWSKIYPYFAIDDLKTQSYYTRLLVSKEFSSESIVDFYAGYKYTKVTTSIGIPQENNKLLNEITSSFQAPSMDRTENIVSIGFVYSVIYDSFIFEFNYEFNKIYRDYEADYDDTNSIINCAVSKSIAKEWLVYVGGRYMEKLSVDLPYLSNEYMSFDKKYGFVQLGFVFSY